jgi:splicing factor 4
MCAFMCAGLSVVCALTGFRACTEFMEKWDARKMGREADLSDYKAHALTRENKGFKMLEKLGWRQGQGLGTDNQGITAPVNK